MTPYFFGYGSLVNRNTHSYPDARTAQLDGWRRQWVRTEGRDIVYLSVVQHPATRIDGLIAAVELVKDRDTKEKFPKEAELGKKMQPILDRHGLLTRAGDNIYMAPPLCITKDEVDYLVKQLDEIIGEVEETL